MDRNALSKVGIQLPVLPTLVLGGLPGGADWTGRLLRLGIDVVSSGAQADTDATLTAVKSAAPYRPIKATGGQARLADGAWLVEDHEQAAGGIPLDVAHIVVAQDGLQYDDQNDVAAVLLQTVRENPAHWWVAARGLGECSPEDAELALSAMVEGTKLVRLFLTKQQFEV
jgi:hypothetical protein